MPLWILIALSVLLGGVAIQNIYVALKPMKNGEKRELEEVFSYGEGPFFVLETLFAFLIWCSDKYFPDRCKLAAFRLISLSMAASLIGFILLLWNLDIVADFLRSL